MKNENNIKDVCKLAVEMIIAIVVLYLSFKFFIKPTGILAIATDVVCIVAIIIIIGVVIKKIHSLMNDE